MQLTLTYSLLLFLFTCFVEAQSSREVVVRDSLRVPERRLDAAKRSDDLARRDVRGCLLHGHDLHYLDGEQQIYRHKQS